jgi:hypothetical protein
MITEIWGLMLELNSGHIKLPRKFCPLPKEFWGNPEYQNPRAFPNFSNDGVEFRILTSDKENMTS